jgi:phosphocarrier protein HPr
MTNANCKKQVLSEALTIINKLGIHARPAAKFVKAANNFKSDVYISKGDYEVNGKNILGILTLAATKGTQITIRAEGDDAGDALFELSLLVNKKFGEE